MGMRVYKFVLPQKVNPTGVTQLQIQAPATVPITILRAWISQSTSSSSGPARVIIVRKTAAATVTAAVIATDIRPFSTTDAASTVQVGTTATGYTATAEGTDGDILVEDNYNILNGWLYLPVPEERIWVPGGGIIALKYPTTPPAATYDCGIIFAEVA